MTELETAVAKAMYEAVSGKGPAPNWDRDMKGRFARDIAYEWGTRAKAALAVVEATKKRPALSLAKSA